ncbi:MAG: RluA family pseudouridine synthase [Lachnospiraceae bacterium]
MRILTVHKNDENQRLDKYLKKYLKEAPGSFIYKMLRKKNIILNGKKADGTEKLRESDEIRLFLAEETIEKFQGGAAQAMQDYPEKKLEILYEDDDLLLLNKPAGELSQKAQEKDCSMNEYALGYLKAKGEVTVESLKVFKPSVCNRLDRNTSGILIVAKTYQAAREFADALQKRTLRKFYRCIVRGELREARQLDGYLRKDEKTNQVRILKEPAEGASEIHTAYRPISHFHGMTLLEVHLITGRTHQIRAHLSSIGHPILGDLKYGDKKYNEKYHQHFQLLHAYRLELDGFQGAFEKYNGKIITAELPKSFRRLMQEE